MATTQIAPQTVFPVGVTKSPTITPPIGVNRFFITAAAVAFRSAAGVGSTVTLGIELSRDAGATWGSGFATYAGGAVTNKQGATIDWVELTYSLGSRGGVLNTDPDIPNLSNANTRARASVTVTGAPVTLGPFMLTTT